MSQGIDAAIGCSMWYANLCDSGEIKTDLGIVCSKGLAYSGHDGKTMNMKKETKIAYRDYVREKCRAELDSIECPHCKLFGTLSLGGSDERMHVYCGECGLTVQPDDLMKIGFRLSAFIDDDTEGRRRAKMFAKQAEGQEQCHDDSCDMGHCSNCGAHIGQEWRSRAGSLCDMCQMISDYNEYPPAIRPSRAVREGRVGGFGRP